MDESGLLMAPLLRRSWSPRGHPAESRHKAGHREKVSVAAALWLTPLREQLRLAFRTLVNGYFNAEAVAEFLQGAVEGLPWPMIVIWDRGNMHRGDPLRELLAQSPGRLDLEPIPPHSPELIPVEQLWKCLKYGRLCNFTPRGAHQLNEAVTRELEAIAEDRELLQSFFHLSALPLPRTLLS
jgi:transposase